MLYSPCSFAANVYIVIFFEFKNFQVIIVFIKFSKSSKLNVNAKKNVLKKEIYERIVYWMKKEQETHEKLVDTKREEMEKDIKEIINKLDYNKCEEAETKKYFQTGKHG